MPNTSKPAMMTVVITGRWMNGADRFTARSSLGGSRLGAANVLARPELLLLVGQAGLEHDRAGAGVDRVVDEHQPALVQAAAAILMGDLHLECMLGVVVAHLRQELLGQVELHLDGLHL